MRSIDRTRGQGALSLELRTAISLALLDRSEGRANAGRLLRGVYGRFTEGSTPPT